MEISNTRKELKCKTGDCSKASHIECAKKVFTKYEDWMCKECNPSIADLLKAITIMSGQINNIEHTIESCNDEIDENNGLIKAQAELIKDCMQTIEHLETECVYLRKENDELKIE
ncbi:hypothetical protein JTB14_007919 [Gonioctena quinquepunctata]|nr:hypothetical protein JTB14_007919 [Gonioctena quinquepunctata]